jgi:hypothetical protein
MQSWASTVKKTERLTKQTINNQQSTIDTRQQGTNNKQQTPTINSQHLATKNS